MKKIVFVFMFLSSLYSFSQSIDYDGVGISTDQVEECAILQIGDLQASSPKKGWLLPRMTTTERNLITNPAKGLLIYNSTDKKIQINNGTPASPDWNNA